MSCCFLICLENVVNSYFQLSPAPWKAVDVVSAYSVTCADIPASTPQHLGMPAMMTVKHNPCLYLTLKGGPSVEIVLPRSRVTIPGVAAACPLMVMSRETQATTAPFEFPVHII